MTEVQLQTSKLIFHTVKRSLGITEDINDYDEEIVEDINISFAKLSSAGVGPIQAFEITAENVNTVTWDDFDKDIINSCPEVPKLLSCYVQKSTKLLFDPPKDNAKYYDSLKELEHEYLERLRLLYNQ